MAKIVFDQVFRVLTDTREIAAFHGGNNFFSLSFRTGKSCLTINPPSSLCFLNLYVFPILFISLPLAFIEQRLLIYHTKRCHPF